MIRKLADDDRDMFIKAMQEEGEDMGFLNT
jgi:hypothetical protein